MTPATSSRHAPLCKLHKIKAHNKSITTVDTILYNWARGLPLNRGFTPITNPKKLNAGQRCDYAFTSALKELHIRLTHTSPFRRVSATEYQRELSLSTDQTSKLLSAIDEASSGARK